MINHASQRLMKGLPRRSAATLSEVLIAMLLMSLGIVGLATLFPVSVMRSIQASQLTNAAVLKMNAQALIDVDRRLIHDPDYDGDYTEHQYTNYLVDPLGAQAAFGLPATVGSLARFDAGCSQAVPPWYPTGTSGVPAADYLATLPDSWVTQFEGLGSGLNTAGTSVDVTGLSTGGVTLPTTVDARAILYRADGKISYTRILTGISGDTISWAALQPVPTGAGGLVVGNVRVETQERRYTWMLTVRKTGAQTATVDVVVFFRRGFDINEEVAYGPPTSANLPPGLAADPDPVAFDPLRRNVDNVSASNQLVINVPAGSRPYIVKGSFVLDAYNAIWYRVQEISPATAPIAGGTMTVFLDRPAVAASNQAVFMRGIIAVYPIGSLGL